MASANKEKMAFILASQKKILTLFVYIIFKNNGDDKRN